MTTKKLKHLRIKKEMNFREQFQTKWREQFRKDIGYYEPIVSLKSLFKETTIMRIERLNNYT